MTEKGVRILIAEADPDEVMVLSRYLGDYDEPVEVTSACNGEEAIRKLRANPYDLCLVDVDLPGMNGLDLLDHIMTHGGDPPVVVITNKGEERAALRAIRMGAYDYLVKGETDAGLLNKTVFLTLKSHRINREKERLHRDYEAYSRRLEQIVKERTEEVVYLNNYKELILENLEEYIRVVDPDRKKIQYESGRIRKEFGDRHRETCFEFMERKEECEVCIAKKAVDEWKVQTKTEFAGDKVFTVTAIPIRNLDGTVSAVEVIKDITEQRRAEEELMEKRRLAAMGEVSAYLAHEIRNPLNGMAINFRLLAESPDVKGDDRVALENLGSNLERLLSISIDLLDYSRSGRLKKEFCDPVRLVNGIVSELEGKISKNRIKVVAKMPDRPLSLKVDRVKIRQAFMNIIVNAVQSMPKGGILNLSMEMGEGDFRLIVSDTGRGIPRENIAKVFVPFFTTRKNGTGLGLPIVKRFVELHGGTVSVDSEVGKGTTVTVTLPLEE